jgi:hypothetical protein
MSLRDISSILRKNHVSHGVVIMGDGSSNNNNNNKKFKMNRRTLGYVVKVVSVFCWHVEDRTSRKFMGIIGTN